MTLIEYKIILIDTKADSVYASMNKLEETLNELGKDGWDCFYVNGNLFYLKRILSNRNLKNFPKENFMTLSEHYAGYQWIKVKKYVRDFNKTAAAQYDDLDSHHIDETSFLIDEVRKLAKQWDERENSLVTLVDALEFLSMQCKDRAKQQIINGREVSEMEREVNEAYADVYDFCVANLKKILDQTKPAK